MKRKFINSDRQQFYLKLFSIHKNILLHLLDNSKQLHASILKPIYRVRILFFTRKIMRKNTVN